MFNITSIQVENRSRNRNMISIIMPINEKHWFSFESMSLRTSVRSSHGSHSPELFVKLMKSSRSRMKICYSDLGTALRFPWNGENGDAERGYCEPNSQRFWLHVLIKRLCAVSNLHNKKTQCALKQWGLHSTQSPSFQPRGAVQATSFIPVKIQKWNGFRERASIDIVV